MRWLLINTDYPPFLEWLYGERRPGLASAPYEEQLAARNDSLFGVADFYSANLRKLGHEAWDVHANNEALQRAWAQEHGVELPKTTRSVKLRWRRRIVPWLNIRRSQDWIYPALLAQIRHCRPDVVLNHDLYLDSRFLKEVKRGVRLLVGQHASPLPPDLDLGPYDLMLSSLPNLVEHFRRAGARSEMLRFAFEPRVLEKVAHEEVVRDVTFVGSVFGTHGGRARWLEEICRRRPVEIFGGGADTLTRIPSTRPCYRGTAWGIEMYRVMRQSRITLNHHIDMADRWANNMRLFEATGVGTMLLTDEKANLRELFEPGREVVTYRSADECADLVGHFLEHPAERASIAKAGQARTLRDHRYDQRMQELSDLAARSV